jgi:glycosyltransferase involved in cell wall biosynthesis
MAAPLVSILIPAHNAAPWLAQTLESALAQRWSRLEVIVVENNSTDDTLAVARRFEARGVRVLVSPRPGAAAARNLAFAESHGDMIQYLDADDLLSPDKISLQMAALDAAQPVVSLSARCEFFDGENPLEAPVERGWPFVPSHDPRAWLADLLGANGRAGFVGLHQWLAPRDLIGRAGPWNETLTVNDDGEFFCRVLLLAREIRTELAAIAYYRRHRAQHSLSSAYRKTRRHVESMITAVDLMVAHFAAGPAIPGLNRAFARHYFEAAVISYPLHPEFSREAERKARQLDAAVATPATSRLAKYLHPVTGWRFERWLAHWYRRLRARA